MHDLTKTRTVLQAQGWVKGRGDTGRAQLDRMVYLAEGDDARTTEMHLDKDLYEDFGQPTQITVTIEPADLLNVVGTGDVCQHCGLTAADHAVGEPTRRHKFVPKLRAHSTDGD